MRPRRINRTYRASNLTLSAYPYGDALAFRARTASGIDHRRQDLTPVIGTGLPTGPLLNVDHMWAEDQLTEGERTRYTLPEAVHDEAMETGAFRGMVCANTPASNSGSRGRDARTATLISMTGTGMTMTREKRVLPDNEKDRCANTGLSQEASSVVVIGT